MYLHSIADSSNRPRSKIYGTLAALSAFYEALALTVVTPSIRRLADALVKCSTIVPLRKTDIMPVQPFMSLFHSWPDNDLLSTKELRLKTICLLSLTFMLRPSDIAPRSVVFDGTHTSPQKVIFSVEQVLFLEDGGMSLSFHGIKNDYTRDGFTVTLPPVEDRFSKVDPIRCLKEYILRTDSIRHKVFGCPVFVTLREPYKAIDSSTVSSILNESIIAAGLSGYSAKCFRPTGATCAIDNKIAPEVARHIGRWRCADTFTKHYVHTRVPTDFVEKLFDHT